MRILTITCTAIRILRLHVPEPKDMADNRWASLELIQLDCTPPQRWDLALSPDEWQAIMEKAHSESAPVQELIELFVDLRTVEAVNDAQNSTSYAEEIRHLATGMAERMTSEELHAYLKDKHDSALNKEGGKGCLNHSEA